MYPNKTSQLTLTTTEAIKACEMIMKLLNR